MLSFKQEEPPADTPGPLREFLRRQFVNIQKAANTAVQILSVASTHKTPDRTNDGDIRRADGSDWNPRFGKEQLYWYSSTDAEWKGLVHVGSGGTVTQATDKTTAVTLNNVTGRITMNNAALAATTAVTFTMTNSHSKASSLCVLNHVGVGVGSYDFYPVCSDGSVAITVYNKTGGSLSQALQLRFLILPGAIS
jgi:hypothetical protein